MKRHETKPSMGILNFDKAKYVLNRYTPSEDIGFFVKHYWIASWDLTGQEPYLQSVVPNPCVNLLFQSGRSAVYAAAKQTYSILLQGKGCVVGAKFKPGGFYPFIKKPVSEALQQPIAVHDMLGIEAREAEELLLSQSDETRMVELLEDLLRPKLPEQDEQVVLVNQIVDRIALEREITKVEQVSECFAMNKRKLQRLFEQYVGLSPKTVIKLYRLQNAAEAMDRGQQPDLLELSLKLGYYDQSHFIKDFKATVGKTPEAYAKQA
ncbi:helix-turn-helix transcriptional regulator [Paenibacillus sp. OAS669]|uniref:helix-turn-helix transcriptional regulator n=1 Tax=Paenibacillus sp. OAS669 TaxID=2663821 RepID=UPI00178A39DD|nr:helix-turn-helix transcriptional regulator [Paenibacillus sp. OAS669]MBE1444162.1 AraC-like DNA-binding protein [Paenibacillus sp. OAS669]